MILVMHVLLAVGGMLSVAWSYILPTRFRLRLSVLLIGLTLVSGMYLVLSLHTRLLQPCIMGLCYLAVATSGVFLARRRLAKQEAIVQTGRREFRK